MNDPLPAPSAKPLPLSAVRLSESPFETARAADAGYLLSLDPNRLLSRFRKFAGMEPLGEEYGGWEKDTISGHSLGHYLSAVAMMYASTGDKRFKERADTVVGELKKIQAKSGDGYVAGLPEHRRLWAEIEKGDVRTRGFDLNGLWVPWYNLHKTLAGLLDAHALCGSRAALEVARKLADWSIHITRNLDEAKWQLMLNCEHGGMNESLAELSARTGERKYLELAEKFYHRAILDPLAEGRDILAGKHGNTQIPKVIGCARLFELTGNEKYRRIAEFFWERVANHHAYAIGGITSGEYFGEPDRLSDRLTGNTAEVCKTYNMLKLTWKLLSWNPQSKLADYAERALYNHILASQNPRNGMMCYFNGLMPGSRKNFSTPFDSFWCCVGSGMENHAKYGEGVAFSRRDTLYINLYLPSMLDWKEGGMRLAVEGDYPRGPQVRVRVEAAPSKARTLKLRVPQWSNGVETIFNGKPLAAKAGADGYLEIVRPWKAGDTLELRIPVPIRTEALPDNPRRVAFFAGPVVLAADLTQSNWEPGRMPVILKDNLTLTPSRSGRFLAAGGRPETWTLRPYWSFESEPASVYFDLFSEAEWRIEENRYRAEEAARLALEKRTVDWFAIGQMQPERDHKLTGESTSAGEFGGRHYRDARNGGYFEFELKVDPEAEQELICTYWGGDQGRTFDILIDGQKRVTQRLRNQTPGKFFDVATPLSDATKGKSMIRIRFQAPPQGMAGGVFGVRIARVAATS